MLRLFPHHDQLAVVGVGCIPDDHLPGSVVDVVCIGPAGGDWLAEMPMWPLVMGWVGLSLEIGRPDGLWYGPVLPL